MVSVIIPSYNHCGYLRERIESVLNQSYRDFELIILDDCSTDQSRDLIEKYEHHEKVTNIIFNDSNSGSVFKQWLKGIALAKGQYIWIAESDDYANEEFLQSMTGVLEKDENISLVYCDSNIVVDENTNGAGYQRFSQVRNQLLDTDLWKHSFYEGGKTFLEKYLASSCCINNTSAVLFRAKYLKELTVDLRTYKYAGDWAAYVDILTKYGTGIYYLHEPLSYYRSHKNNASKQSLVNNKLYFERFRVVSRCYEWFKENSLDTNVYIRSVKSRFLPLLVVSRNRGLIFKEYAAINKELINRMVWRLPGEFVKMILIKLRLKPAHK